ncbi:hypothetical protein LTR36_000408 [Oleoguttula mirabilis]|uniref:Uncharacterized protein n=1 Tax=Oleoguttula mirabilis TaxID=1507867 RepID=A0AAV9JYG0_9PEZI|nr:hypothetical protein LTR36_000408 [Oleoguttula mirabilis]
MFRLQQQDLGSPAIYLEPASGRGHVRQRSSVARIDFQHEARDKQELQVVEPLLEEEKEHSNIARPAIRLQTQRFNGSLDFKARHGFIPTDSPSMKYVGSNSEVDVAWDELAEDRYFLLSDEEARRAYGSDTSGYPPAKYWNVHHGGYVAGLDVLHTLHCLNHLRTTLYPHVYPQDPQNGVMHAAHCIDHLRQLAMCYSDLTPIPTQWFDGIGQNYINSSQVHTCRNFWDVRDWATERFNGSTAVKPRNRDGSPRDSFYAPWSS